MGERVGAMIEPNEVDPMAERTPASAGIGFLGFGSALAITISWSLHESILWAILHGFFSWFYVVYYAATRQ